MFLRSKTRKKDGKVHRYYSVVENRRVGAKRRTVQRTVMHLGEISSSQEAAWRQTLAVFDEERQEHRTLSLFADAEDGVPASVDRLRVRLSEMELRHPRAFGACWLGCELWRQLGLEEFWQEHLSQKVRRETVDWEKVLRLLVINRLMDPGSEFRVHRQWFDHSAMGELLGEDFAVAEKDRLYRCLDRILEHKPELFAHLRQRWADLFGAEFDVLLYALAPGLTPKAVLEKLAAIQMLDVWLPTTDGRWLVMPRYTQPEPEQAILLHKLQLRLPQQPPPRIKLQHPSRSNETLPSVVPTF